MALGEIGFSGLRMREEENEREEGAMKDDPDEYGSEIDGNIGSFNEISEREEMVGKEKKFQMREKRESLSE